MNQTQVARIAEIVALVMTQMSGKPVKTRKAKPVAKPKPSSADHKSAFAAAVKAKFGETEAFTYNLWLEKGFKVKPGEKATRVKSPSMTGKGIPLFSAAQVEKIA